MKEAAGAASASPINARDREGYILLRERLKVGSVPSEHWRREEVERRSRHCTHVVTGLVVA